MLAPFLALALSRLMGCAPSHSDRSASPLCSTVPQHIFTQKEILIRDTLSQRCLAILFKAIMDRDHSRSNVWPYRQYDGGDRYKSDEHDAQ